MPTPEMGIHVTVQFFTPPILCPECGGPLDVEISEWETDTGKPTEGGIIVYCRHEEEEEIRALAENDYPEWEHDHWQSTWQPTIDWIHKYIDQAGIRKQQ